MNVTRYTRAGRDGKVIQCPHGPHHFPVWNFAWSAIRCDSCRTDVAKYDWILL